MRYRIIVVMKRIVPLFCLALAALPLTGQAADLGIGVGGVTVKVAAGFGDPGDRFERRRHGGGGGGGGGDDGGRGGGENRNDNGVNVAKNLASRYGRVLDASQISDTVYIVRVMKPNGERVDLTVDVRSGRVSGG